MLSHYNVDTDGYDWFPISRYECFLFSRLRAPRFFLTGSHPSSSPRGSCLRTRLNKASAGIALTIHIAGLEVSGRDVRATQRALSPRQLSPLNRWTIPVRNVSTFLTTPRSLPCGRLVMAEESLASILFPAPRFLIWTLASSIRGWERCLNTSREGEEIHHVSSTCFQQSNICKRLCISNPNMG